MSVAAVSASFFKFFDAPPAIGRYFAPADDALPDGHPVAVISHAYWQTAFGERANAIGSTLQIGPDLYTIIGVAPKGFVGLWPERAPVAYIPLVQFGAVQARHHGFLKHGVSGGRRTAGDGCRCSRAANRPCRSRRPTRT